tara:strand:- start:502 stop:798 length:297 start_codon:yes stop_codon:yes gene_type:complete
MAHFAELDENNVVLQVVVINNADINDPDNTRGLLAEPEGLALLETLYGAGRIWKQSSINENFRGTHAIEEGTYNSEYDKFVPPNIELDENGDYIPPTE